MTVRRLVARSASGSTRSFRQTNARKAFIRQLSGDELRVTLPFAPNAVQYGGFGLEYSQFARPGRKPLLEATAQKNRTVKFSARIADRDSKGTESIEELLDDLETIANQDIDCVFVYGVQALPYRVRVSKFSYTDVWRARDGTITQADIDIQLDERPIIDQEVVALAAITYEPEPEGTTGKGGSGGEEDDGASESTPSWIVCTLAEEGCPRSNSDLLIAPGGGGGSPQYVL